jgi:UDP-N-acetylmuramoyl-tripeptide--D-alanyl-D-alanine ligase
VLNVGRAHVGGYFADQDEVAEAKGELVEALPADGLAALNADDPRVSAMFSRTVAPTVTFGRSATARVRATGVTVDGIGRPSFTLVTPTGSAPVRLNLRGEHNVSNALAAAALAGGLGLGTDAIAAGLSEAVPRSRYRMEVTRRPDGVTVINDAYNASPDSVQAGLAALAGMANGGRTHAVLGLMAELGPNSRAWHEEVGATAARLGVSTLIVVGDEARPMLAGARSVPGWPGEPVPVPDAAAALKAVTDRVAPGDAVLVKASKVVGLWDVAIELAAEADR